MAKVTKVAKTRTAKTTRTTKEAPAFKRGDTIEVKVGRKYSPATFTALRAGNVHYTLEDGTKGKVSPDNVRVAKPAKAAKPATAAKVAKAKPVETPNFKRGDEVESKWKPNGRKYWPATVVRFNKNAGTIKIKWEEDGAVNEVQADMVRYPA